MARNVRQRHEASVSKSSEARVGKDRVPLKNENSRVPIDNLQEIVNPARVRVGAGVTKPTERQFESIRVDIAVEWPCEPTKEAVEKTYKRVSKLVDSMIEEEIAYAEDRM